MEISQKFRPKCCEEQGTCIRRILNLATTLPFNLALIIGGTDMKIRVNDDDIALSKRLCCEEIDEIGCSETFQTIAFTLMDQYNLSFPKTYFQAADLYKNLIALIENIQTEKRMNEVFHLPNFFAKFPTS